MWVVSKNILDYFSKQDISGDKKNELIQNYKKFLIKIISKLSAEEINRYLFDEKTLKNLKIMICEYVNELSSESNRDSKVKSNEILEDFKKRYTATEGLIKADYIPDIIKKYIIDTLYEKDKIKVVLDKNTDNKIIKNILRLGLSSYEYARVLSKDLSKEIEDYIIDECLVSSVAISNVIENKNISQDIKDRVINTKVNSENVLEVVYFLRTSTYDKVLFDLKFKDIEDYINSLNYRTVLGLLNGFNTPVLVYDYLFLHKFSLIEKAIKKASHNDLETMLLRERDERIVKLIVKLRPKHVYSIIDKFFTFQFLSWLKLKYLPKEYKDYIMNKHHKKLIKAIKEMKNYDIKEYLSKGSCVPDVAQELIFMMTKDRILEYFSKEDDKEIIRSIRYGSLGIRLKRFLIEERINKDNLFLLLGEQFLDEETLRFTLELKKDLIKEHLFGLSNNQLFCFNNDKIKSEVIESIMESNQDLIKERLDKLNQDELFKYLDNDNVRLVVKRIILKRYGINSDDIENILYLIGEYDTKLILEYYDEVKAFIYNVGIDFNSFLQYGSGSRRYAKWLDRILDILYISEDEEEFIKCKDYLFSYYYTLGNNAVYEINSFLELLENYADYKELFLDLESRHIIL